MKKYGIYARTACSDELRIENQIIECKEFIKRNNGQAVLIYRDNGCSGMNTDRSAFQIMIRDIVSEKPDHIVATSLDRFTRDMTIAANLYKLCRYYDINLLTLDEEKIDYRSNVISDVLKEILYDGV